MRFTLSRRWLIWGGILAAVVFVIVVDRAEDYVGHISYPLGTWRMDLDDALVGCGTILIGAAAIWTVWLKAKDADLRSRKLEHEINGGMAESAREHVNGALEDAGLEVGLSSRVIALEQENMDCAEAKKECLEENKKLRDWVVARLDYSVEGREGER